MDGASEVKAYIEKHSKHKELLIALRDLIKEFPFEETIKWRMPTYMSGGKNLVGLGAFKEHVAIWFFQGALLDDPKGLLHNAQDGKTKAMRQIHFKTANEIDPNTLRPLLLQTIENQKKGLKVKIERKPIEVDIPEILQSALDEKKLSDSFFSLTPGKQKDYCLYIVEAKRAQTKIKRLEKILPMIAEKKGLYDKYKNC